MWFDPADLVQKRHKPAANFATLATDVADDKDPPANVAEVALVATPRDADAVTDLLQESRKSRESQTNAFSAADVLPAPAWVWLAPDASRVEALRDHPDGVAAEPIDVTAPASRPVTESEAAELHALVAAIYARDSEAERAEALELALADAEGALTCYRSIAVERGLVINVSDDLRRCDQCLNLTHRGLCLAARRGEIVASRSYTPIRDLHRRCEGYAPWPGDPDRRPGRQRWPGLTQKGRDDANT